MCCLFFRNCCRCCGQRPVPPAPPTPTPPRPSLPIINVGARFNLLSSSEVAGGSAIPLTNTVFNNAGSYIVNNNGAIALAGEGLYLVNYSVTATNNTEDTASFLVNLNVNGAVDSSASAPGIIPSGESGIVSNSTLVYVPQNSTTNVSLSVTSEQTLSYLPNVVVTKLS